MLQDLIGGQLNAGFAVPPAAAPHAMAGRLHALAVSGERRSIALPNAPTLREELGFEQPVFQLRQWATFWSPAGTPAATLTRLEHELTAALDDAAVRQALQLAGFEIERALGAADAAATLRADLALIPPLIRAFGRHAAVRRRSVSQLRHRGRDRRQPRRLAGGARAGRSRQRDRADRARPHRRATVRCAQRCATGAPRTRDAHQRPARDRVAVSRVGPARCSSEARNSAVAASSPPAAICTRRRATRACTRAARCSRRSCGAGCSSSPR